ncbi:MAG: hypothetical protein JNN15_20165, partial [Blastocatellia bacterium]|nr:hypothetical protein [Blastocatellia bacterium]
MKFYRTTLLLLLLSFCFTSTNAQQSTTVWREYPFMVKRTEVPATLASKDLEITLQLDGLQPLDFINVRPKERNFGVTGGVVRKGIERGIQTGGNLSASCATLSTDTLTFVRPAVFQDPVFLHIEIPEGARVKIIMDGKVMLNASITDPIAFRNGEVLEGRSNAAGAMFHAAVAGPVNVVQK